MSVYRNKGHKTWTMDFRFHKQRIRENTGVTSKKIAQKIERDRIHELEEGLAGISGPCLFSAAAEGWLETKKTKLAPRSVTIAEVNLKRLLPVFGRHLVAVITALDIARYQQGRRDEGASPKTINMEIGTLRSILRSSGHWARLQEHVDMLYVRDDIGRAITAKEAALLEACSQSRSRSLVTFVTLAIETGARYGTIRTLQWGSIDLENFCLKWGQDKTKAGTGRTVPLSQRAVAALSFWATNFPDRKPEHYVFPSERYGNPVSSSEPTIYGVDPTKPIVSIKEAWRSARDRAGEILGLGKRLECRFHDLRHTAVSRMINSGVPLTTVAKIAGWAQGTTVLMATRYGHADMGELRRAVETISGGKNPQISHYLGDSGYDQKVN